MNILFEARIMNTDFAGMAKSVYYLYYHCHRICPDFHAYGFHTRRQAEYPEAGITLLGNRSKRELLDFAREHEIQIVHYPANFLTWPVLSELKTVLTVHDLIPYEYPCPTHRLPSRWIYILRTRHSLKKADLVTTISEYSRQSISCFSGGQVSPVPIYWSVTLPDAFAPGERPDYRYFLYVGGYSERKGIDILVPAFLDMKRRGLTDCKLVLAGRPCPLNPHTDGLIQTGVAEGSILQTGYVSDEALCSLYANAVCAVYLSSMEGFGLPLLEAMKYDCPVVTPRNTCLPEVGGDAACYVDRDNREELIAMLLRLEQDEAFRGQHIQAGRENLKRFDWDRCARQYLDTLSSLMER